MQLDSIVEEQSDILVGRQPNEEVLLMEDIRLLDVINRKYM